MRVIKFLLIAALFIGFIAFAWHFGVDFGQALYENGHQDAAASASEGTM